MKSDIWKVLDYSLEIMKSALNDVSKINLSDKNKALDLLFKGIIHIVAIPVLSKVISKKIPVIGSFFSKIIKKILTLVSDKIKFDGEDPKEERELDSLQDYSGSKIALASKRIEKVLSSSISVVQLPIKIGLAITSSILIIFIYLIN
jgi:hypothetical protein